MTIQLSQSQLQNPNVGMSTIDPPGPVDPSLAAGAYLSPEALLAYVETKLKNTDSQIQGVLAQQENIDWEQQQIGSILQEISADQSKVDSNTNTLNDPAEAQQLEQKVEDLITQIEQRDPGCPVLGQLKSLHDTIMATGTGPYTTKDANGNLVQHGYYNGTGGQPGDPPDGPSPPQGVRPDADSTFGSDELQHFTDALNSANNDLGSASQLNMIQVQSKMSDRSTAIQLATNILQSYDDGLSKIAANIGH